MKTYLACCGIVILFLVVSYIWGRSFLHIIKTKADFSSSILFGFMAILISYQIPYVPVFLLRGSYKMLSLIWFFSAALITVYLLFRMIKGKRIALAKPEGLQMISTGFVSALFLYLCVFISLHPPAYGPDTNAYINTMNRMYHNDTIWIENGDVNVHHGMNSLFGLMTIPSLILHIKPYYISLFTMRIMLVVLAGMSMYRIGKIILKDETDKISVGALWVSAVTSVVIMFWNSGYQAHFFFRRSNEAKSYCQFILHPLAFSVFLQMCTEKDDRRELWIQQLLIGLSAVAISMSSLTGYPFLVFMGMLAVLAYDRFRKPARTILWSLLCAAPNMLYLVFYFFVKSGYIVL